MVDEARQVISNILGSAMAAKASPAFCLAFGQPGTAYYSAALEGNPRFLPNQPIIIEFEREADAVADAYNALDRLRDKAAWTNLVEAIGEMINDAPDASHLLPLHPIQLLRQAKIKIASDDFYRTAGPVRNEIEKLSLELFRLESAMEDWSELPLSVTEVCWLNRSLKTYLNPRMLANLAADESVALIDLPRRLWLELNVTGATVGAVDFRRDFQRTGKGVIVAIVDQEVHKDHPNLTPRVARKENFSRESWDRPGTHATALAGIIGSNHTTFTGMAPEVQIFNYKVEASNPRPGDDFQGAQGITRALEDGAHIANCSWGTGPAGDGTSREAKAVDKAWKCGLVVVKSAGNCGPGKSTMTIPADAEGVIVVGATGRIGTDVQDYSARGPANGKDRPHLVAPGGTEAQGVQSCDLETGFQQCPPGTSFAAAHVSGILALILEGDRNLTPDQLRDKLLGFCHPFRGPASAANTSGKGFVRLPSGPQA